MRELEPEEILEETEFANSGNDDSDNPAEFGKLISIHDADRARFEPIPDENKAAGNDSASAPYLADLINSYYRSMSAIPLLTREQEIQLAKTLESTKFNMLRLLSQTPITSFLLMEMKEDLHPVAFPDMDSHAGIGKKTDAEREEASLEERTQIRLMRINKILAHLEMLESKYRRSLLRSRSKAHRKPNRAAIFKSLRRIAFTESLIFTLIEKVETVLRAMERESLLMKTQKPANKAAGLNMIERQHLTSRDELQDILSRIRMNQPEICMRKISSCGPTCVWSSALPKIIPTPDWISWIWCRKAISGL